MAKKVIQPVEVQASVKGDQSVKSFKQQIREAQQETLHLAAAFGETDARTLAAAQRVAQLKDQMEDVNATIQGLHPDRFQAIANITGTMANGFAAAQGAAALLGGESEDLQKAMVRIQGAMAFSQGIAGLKDLQFQFASLGKMVTDAFTAMKAAIGSTGIGALLIALGAAVTYVAMNWKELTGQLSDSEKAARATAAVMREGAGSVEDQRLQIEYYRKVINDTNRSETERIEAFRELQTLVPSLTDNEIDNANALAMVNEELDVQIKHLVVKAQMDALIAKQAENNNKIAELQSQNIAEQASTMQKAWNYISNSILGPSAAIRAEVANIKDGLTNINNETKQLTAENKSLEEQLKNLQGQLLTTGSETRKYGEDAEKAAKKSTKATDYSIERQIALLELEEDGVDKRRKLANLNFQLQVKQLKEYGLTAQQIEELRMQAEKKALTDYYKEVEDKQKQHLDTMNAQKEKAGKSEIDYINSKFDEEELAVLKSAKTQEEADKALEKITLQRQRNLIQSLKDQGKSTTEIEAQIERDRLKAEEKKTELQKKADEKAKDDSKKKLEQQQADIQMGFAAAQTMVSLFDALTTNSNAKTEEERKKEFERKKSFETVAAIISTIGAAQAAYASQIIPGEPTSVVRASVAAAIATAQGMARVAAIRKQQYQTGAPSNSGAGPGSLAAQRPSMPGSASSLGGGSQFAGQEATRVYVTEGDITQTQRRVKMLKSGSSV